MNDVMERVGTGLRTMANAQVARLYGLGAMPGVTDDGTGHVSPSYGRTVTHGQLYENVNPNKLWPGRTWPDWISNRVQAIAEATEGEFAKATSGRCLALNVTKDGRWLLPPSRNSAYNSLADYLSSAAARVVRAEAGKELEMVVELEPKTDLKEERLASYITVSTFRTTTPTRGGVKDFESRTFVCNLTPVLAVGGILGILDEISNPIGYRK